MRKKYLKLTKEQKSRGVIFSSELKGGGLLLRIHEVTKDSKDYQKTIEMLKDDSFFDESPFDYNLIRQ